jgi:hypothetical protein
MSNNDGKKRGEAEFPYKANAAVDGAPKFASRWVTHFHCCAHGFCITVAGCLSISTGILAIPCAGSRAVPLQPYAFFATRWRISRISPTG